MESTEKYRVLIVDDQPEVLKYHLKAMSDSGMECTLVESVDQALETISSKNEFDLFIIDRMLPEKVGGISEIKQGEFLYEKIRKIGINKPIVIFSNYIDTDILIKYEDSKIILLDKGLVSPNEMADRVVDIIDSSSKGDISESEWEISRLIKHAREMQSDILQIRNTISELKEEVRGLVEVK